MLKFLRKISRNKKIGRVCLCRYQNPHVHITYLSLHMADFVSDNSSPNLQEGIRSDVDFYIVPFLCTCNKISIVWSNIYDTIKRPNTLLFVSVVLYDTAGCNTKPYISLVAPNNKTLDLFITYKTILLRRSIHTNY